LSQNQVRRWPFYQTWFYFDNMPPNYVFNVNKFRKMGR
jgi:hypothetical protein